MRKRAMMPEERRNKIKNSLRITGERRKTPMEHRELTPVEIIASGFERLSISPYVKLSMVNETGSLNALA